MADLTAVGTIGPSVSQRGERIRELSINCGAKATPEKLTGYLKESMKYDEVDVLEACAIAMVRWTKRFENVPAFLSLCQEARATRLQAERANQTLEVARSEAITQDPEAFLGVGVEEALRVFTEARRMNFPDSKAFAPKLGDGKIVKLTRDQRDIVASLEKLRKERDAKRAMKDAVALWDSDG